MTFNDWQDTANVDPLTLPIRDRDGVRREYTIPPLGYLDAIKLREETDRIREDGPAAATMSNEEFLRIILGGQLQAMRDDNVPPQAIVHAATVAHTDAFSGREAAEKLWNEGPDPEALAAALTKVAAASSTTSPATAGRVHRRRSDRRVRVVRGPGRRKGRPRSRLGRHPRPPRPDRRRLRRRVRHPPTADAAQRPHMARVPTLVGGLLAADTRLTRHLSRNRNDDTRPEGGDDE
jgi:hypothetical protein